jgi:hypothetical protein
LCFALLLLRQLSAPTAPRRYIAPSLSHLEHEDAQQCIKHHVIHIQRLPEPCSQRVCARADHLVGVLRRLSCKCACKAHSH